ncbi:MAG TPA: hypothetical protein VGI39_06820 [Polyangiaceae bacterium]
MATFLTSRKMPAALAARVEASVRGKRAKKAIPQLAKGLLRVALVAGVIALVSAMVVAHRREVREREAMRAALAEKVRSESAGVSEGDAQAVVRAERILVHAGGTYEGDFVADELRGSDAIAAILTRPSMYLHAPIEAYASAEAIEDAAATSVKDAILYCWGDPPSGRAEKAVLSKVRIAYGGGARVEQATPGVRRLGEALAGLPFFQPAWRERVEGATDMTELKALREAMDKAPLERARRALKAELFIAVVDEPGDKGIPAELDGERPHGVRVEVFDLASGKTLLRVRKSVDPAWISQGARLQYSTGLDACLVGMDVREAGVPAAAASESVGKAKGAKGR